MKLSSFEKPNKRESLVYTLEVTSCVGNTKASSENIVFKGASIYQKDLYISTPGNNINNINSDELLIELLFHHLEHLDSLRERHAYRLNRRVGCNLIARSTTRLTRNTTMHISTLTLAHTNTV